jgi:hypothetical protein
MRGAIRARVCDAGHTVVSALDVLQAAAPACHSESPRAAANAWTRLKRHITGSHAACRSHCTFDGVRQKPTPVVSAKGARFLIARASARSRRARAAAALVRVRYAVAAATVKPCKCRSSQPHAVLVAHCAALVAAAAVRGRHAQRRVATTPMQMM